jgi:hypothetical protein
VLFALSSTMIRLSGKPRSISILRICPASVLPFCGLPPVTMIGDCGKNCATVRPVSTRRRRIVRIVPSGLSPYPRMTIAGFEKSFAAGAGSAWDTAGDTSPNIAATASTIAPATAFHRRRMHPPQRRGPMGFRHRRTWTVRPTPLAGSPRHGTAV